MNFTPTVGRKVWFFFHNTEMHADYKAGEPCDATVVAVNDDGTVNLAVLDRSANLSSKLNVTLIQPDEPKPTEGNYASWMPYQVKVMEKDQQEEYKNQEVQPPQA